MKWRIQKTFFLLAFALARTAFAAPEPPAVLTNASDVLALPAERAIMGVPIRIRGVITATEKYWDGRFFIQDASAGVFVDNVGGESPSVGDLVEVSGISHPGAFAPVISKPAWKKVGTALLPPAKPTSTESLMAGIDDGQRIEITGTVRTVADEHSLLSLDLVSGGHRFHVFAKRNPDLASEKLIGARVQVRGTAAPSFNAQLRQLIGVKVFAPLLEDFVVQQPESTDPFNEPTLSLASVAQYRPGSRPQQRIRVKGTLTCQRPGEDLFVLDDSGGLQIKTPQRERFPPGDVIEAVGFPGLDHFLPVLEDAICRKTENSRDEMTPRRALTEELQAGLHHADLITLRGKLLERVVRRSLDHTSEAMQIDTILTLQGEGMIFSAEAETSEEPQELVSVPIGSVVEVTGVCLSEIDQDGRLKLLKLLLSPSRPLRVLDRPSWFTPQHLSVTLAIAMTVLLVALTGMLVTSKKNSLLKVLVREREHAQKQLQQAHDSLEARVKVRTEQLKQQITARKESELQFNAVLSERTRLAQELHDTVEQSLTGIALQMDTATRLVEQSPNEANHHFKLARTLLRQGQLDIRRSVWDLRSRALDQFDLPSILTATSRQLTDGTKVSVNVTAHRRVRPLPDLVEDNLLRIAQEALTNVIKHAGATTATIDLDYGAENVFLEIKDNGKGFSTNDHLGPEEGHFGLLGISERVKRINGEVTIESNPNSGTTVRVKIPLKIEQELQLAELAGLDI
jgi:signal transduction histidine kinase